MPFILLSGVLHIAVFAGLLFYVSVGQLHENEEKVAEKAPLVVEVAISSVGFGVVESGGRPGVEKNTSFSQPPSASSPSRLAGTMPTAALPSATLPLPPPPVKIPAKPVVQPLSPDENPSTEPREAQTDPSRPPMVVRPSDTPALATAPVVQGQNGAASVELDPTRLDGGVAGALGMAGDPSSASSAGASGGAANGPAAGGRGRTGAGDGVNRGPLNHDQILAQLDSYASDVRAKDKGDRALYSKVLRDYGSKFEDHWDVSLEQVRKWPLTPTIQLAYAANHGLQDFLPKDVPGLDISTPCPYARYSVALVQVVVDKTGALVSKSIVRSSGSRRLDKEALSLVARSAPFPPPEPMDLSQEGISRSVWDFGVRDYTQSTCRAPKMKPIVKDILLMAVY